MIARDSPSSFSLTVVTLNSEALSFHPRRVDGDGAQQVSAMMQLSRVAQERMGSEAWWMALLMPSAQDGTLSLGLGRAADRGTTPVHGLYTALLPWLVQRPLRALEKVQARAGQGPSAFWVPDMPSKTEVVKLVARPYRVTCQLRLLVLQGALVASGVEVSEAAAVPLRLQLHVLEQARIDLKRQDPRVEAAGARELKLLEGLVRKLTFQVAVNSRVHLGEPDLMLRFTTTLGGLRDAVAQHKKQCRRPPPPSLTVHPARTLTEQHLHFFFDMREKLVDDAQGDMLEEGRNALRMRPLSIFAKQLRLVAREQRPRTLKQHVDTLQTALRVCMQLQHMPEAKWRAQLTAQNWVGSGSVP